MKNSKTLFSFFALIVMLVYSCKSDKPENPYEDIDRNSSGGGNVLQSIPDTNFAWLHARIFRPTCANSGCHDGTFEPEFRTIASAYNSLVNHPVIANNPSNSFSYRVVPGNAAMSWLHERITNDVENTSGMMPLYPADTTPDWIANKSIYIQKITDWINAGAKDMYGNPAPTAGGNAAPLVYGMQIFPSSNTTTPYMREEGSSLPIGNILVPAQTVDVWLLAYDDNALLTNFESVSIKLSDDVSDFSGAITVPCTLSGPITSVDFTGNSSPFYYKATIDLSGIAPGQTRFIRAYVDDGVQSTVTEIPNASSNFFWYLLFSLKIQ